MNAPLPVPFMVQIHTTNKCNQNCQFCWLADSPRDSEELSDERWIELADEICALKVPQVVVTGGGEPTIRNSLLIRLMRKFAKASIEGVLITNGTLLTKQFAKKLVDMQWDAVQVSIHSPTAELHDTIINTKGSFERTLKGISHLNEQKKLNNSEFPELKLRLVLTHSNYSLLPDYINLAKSLRAQGIHIKAVSGEECTTERLSPSAEQMSQFRKTLDDASAIADDAHVSLELEFELPQDESDHVEHQPQHDQPQHDQAPQENTPCPLPFSELMIFANGTASPCPYYAYMQFQSEKERKGWLENLKKTPLKTAWETGFSALRSSMLSGDELFHACKECSRDKKSPVTTFVDRRLDYLRKHRRYDEGYQFCTEQLAREPDNHQLLIRQAEFSIELGQHESALQALEKLEGATLENEHLFHLWYARAICYKSLEKYGQMQECFEKTTSFPEFFGKHESHRETLLKEFAEFWPSSFYTEKFQQYLEKDNTKGFLEFAGTQEPNTKLHILTGKAHMLLEDYDSAIAHLRLADSEEGMLKLVECHFEKGDYNESLALSARTKAPREYLKLSKLLLGESIPVLKSGTMFSRAFRHLRSAGLFQKGIEFGSRNLKTHRNNPELHHHLGEFSMELGEYDAAIEYLSTAVQLNPHSEWTRFSLGKCFYLTHQYDSAERAFHNNIELTSDKLSHYHSWLFLAMSADDRGDTKTADSALAHLNSYKEFKGQETPLEQEYLTRRGVQ